jgi:hypothetical protein
MVKPADGTQRKSSPRSYVHRQPFSGIFRFRITLQDVQPAVWRRIEVPGTYSFWDLHVALTDVFGWWDSHLHEWNVPNLETGAMERLGMWDDGDTEITMDWDVDLAARFIPDGLAQVIHQYDFGDGWVHLVEFEGLHPKEKGVAYPRCLEGENACPPDDCGGPWGYEELLEILDDPTHEEYAHRLEWLGSMKGIDAKKFDPRHFDPADVPFDDPEKRWQVAFNDKAMTPDMRMFETFKQRGME